MPRLPHALVVLTLIAILAGCSPSTANSEPQSSGAAASSGGAKDKPMSSDPAPARFVEGKPVGLYFMTRYWSFTQTLEKAAWYFAPDGQVYQNLESGFSPEDLEAHKGPKGKYQVDGNTMVVTWSDGKTSESELDREEDAFTWDAGIFTPVQPIKDPKAIAATYEGGESLSHGGNVAMTSHTLELRPDGTYSWHGVASLSAETDETELSASSEDATTGTWKASDYSLTLTDNRGQVTRKIAFPYDDEDTPQFPDRLFFGGTMFKRQ